MIEKLLQAKVTVTSRELELASSFKRQLDSTNIPTFGILCKEEISLHFKLAYFAKMGKAAKITEAREVLLQLECGFPLSLLLYVLIAFYILMYYHQ